jgi:hypothetical protein
MPIEDNNIQKIKRIADLNKEKQKQRRLNPGAQRIIMENSTVNKIRGEIDYANAFLLRSFRLSLRMEDAEN